MGIEAVIVVYLLGSAIGSAFALALVSINRCEDSACR
jgi:hypothetical protein